MNIFQNFYYLRHNDNFLNYLFENIRDLDNFFNRCCYWNNFIFISINSLDLNINLIYNICFGNKFFLLNNSITISNNLFYLSISIFNCNNFFFNYLHLFNLLMD